MQNNILPNINKEVLKRYESTNDGSQAYDFIFLIVSSYLNYIAKHENQELALSELSDDQHTILAYYYLYVQVENDGFMGLIKNGYGLYIFQTPFEENIKKLGAVQISNIICEAKKIYEKCKDLTQKMNEEEFLKQLDSFYLEFAPLDDKFYNILHEQTLAVKDYMIRNIEKFAIVI